MHSTASNKQSIRKTEVFFYQLKPEIKPTQDCIEAETRKLSTNLEAQFKAEMKRFNTNFNLTVM